MKNNRFSSSIVRADNTSGRLTCPHCGSAWFYKTKGRPLECSHEGDEVVCAECSHRFVIMRKHYKEEY